MKTNPTRLLLDTNVWLDLFASDRSGREDAVNLVTWAVQQEVTLLYAASSIKDFYYILEEREKRKLRAAKIEVDAGTAADINEYAWGCIRALEEIATVVALDQSDVWLASKFRALHSDFEDNLILAALERSSADYLITADEVLLKRSPAPALSPGDLLTLVQGCRQKSQTSPTM
ncbi:MAG: PIN domain-containing protein [Raoultibacter sp.]